MAMCGSECDVYESWLALNTVDPGGKPAVGGVFGMGGLRKKVNWPVVKLIVAKATTAT
jgi:hypothetical protein